MTSGSCLCGRVAFELGGELSGMSNCHCSMCRKIHGGAFATYMRADTLAWTNGEDLVEHYESSPGFVRAFCNCCGSVLPHYSPKRDLWVLSPGLLDDDPGVKPVAHIFTESKAPWYEIEDDLEQLEQYGAGDSRPIVQRPDNTGDAGTEFCGGSCACDTVKFRFSGKPALMMYCHCSRCRKVKGASHAANLFIKPEQLEWLEGEDNVVRFDLPGADRFGNSFCKTCGSSVPRQAAVSPTFNVPVGSLDDTPDIKPKGHIFVDSKAPWDDLKSDLPKYAEMPDS